MPYDKPARNTASAFLAVYCETNHIFSFVALCFVVWYNKNNYAKGEPYADSGN